MQSQNPSWRNARSSPAGGEPRRAARARAPTPRRADRGQRGLEAEEAAVDPVARCEASRRTRAPGRPRSARRRRTGARAARRSSSPAGRVPLMRRRGARAGRCRLRRRRRWRRTARRRAAGGPRAQPPTGRRIEAGVEALDRAHPPATAVPRDERLDQLAPGSRSGGRTGGTPARGRSASHARESAGRRSRPAAWESTGVCSCSRVPRPPQRIATVRQHGGDYRSTVRARLGWSERGDKSVARPAPRFPCPHLALCSRQTRKPLQHSFSDWASLVGSLNRIGGRT